MLRRAVATLGVLLLVCLPAMAAVPPPTSPAAKREAKKLAQLPPVYPHGKPHIDHSGRKERGRASYYARYFDGRLMANGRPMNPNADIAASKTLPLGTVATVTNLENGRSEKVKIEDRGPFIDGRVVDLTPKVANALRMRKQGVVPVVVKPITIPLPNGKVKLGAGAANATPREIRQAAKTTRALVGDSHLQTASRGSE